MDPSGLRKASDFLKMETAGTTTIKDEVSNKEEQLSSTDPPNFGQWHSLVRIELMDNKISELPQSPDCPKLKVLLLQGNVDLMDIPDSFFDHMPLLQYLDLSNTSIRELPPSISKLKELKKFYLESCDLFLELSPKIGQLKKLEELDLDQTLITHLPQEVRELINLQSLILCFDQELGYDKKGNQISTSTLIPPGVVSNLTELNYLSINVDPEDERWNKNVTNLLVEIFELERLETLNIYVPKAEILELIPAHKFLNLKLVVGHQKHRFIRRVTPEVEQKFNSCERSIKFVNGVNVPNGVNMNLGRFGALYLDRHMTIKSMSEFDLKKLRTLQICILAECNEMETVVDGSYSHEDGPALPYLESLSVFYMKNLRSICEGSNPSFFYLKSIALHTCPMLTTIFTLDSLKNLSLLEELIVEDCPKVTTLISHNHNSLECETHSSLPRLRMVLLLYLPELVSIFNGLHVGEGLRLMGFYYCPKLQSLSKLELSSKSLRVIKGESKWWEALQWDVAEWGDAGRPNFLDLICSPINEEVDIMTQLVACYDEIQRQDEEKCERKRKSLVPLEGPRPPAIRVSKESHKIRKPLLPETDSYALMRRSPVITYYSSASEFRSTVQRLTGSPEETNSSEKERVQSKTDDIIEMFETNTLREDEEETVK